MPERTLKVLMVGPGRKVKGGISSVVNSYYKMQMDRQLNLKYIASMEDGNKIKKFLIAFKAYIEFCWCLRDYDIVHIHMAAQASFLRKSLFVKRAYKAKKYIVIHQHAADFDVFFFEQSNRKEQNRIKSVFAMADRIVALSDEWADFYRTYICEAKKVVVIHNSVIMPELKRKNYSDHGVLFLGRLGERKGVYDLMKAIPQIIRKVPDAVFYFGGDGEIERCKEISQIQGTEDQVQMLGWIEKSEREYYLKNVSILILPSYHEGMPMAILEAMSYGLAVIATDVGGISQIIENNVSGIFIKAGDIEGLADAIIDLLQHQDKKRKIGQTGFERVREKFNAEKKIKELYNLYYGLFCE